MSLSYFKGIHVISFEAFAKLELVDGKADAIDTELFRVSKLLETVDGKADTIASEIGDVTLFFDTSPVHTPQISSKFLLKLGEAATTIATVLSSVLCLWLAGLMM